MFNVLSAIFSSSMYSTDVSPHTQILLYSMKFTSSLSKSTVTFLAVLLIALLSVCTVDFASFFNSAAMHHADHAKSYHGPPHPKGDTPCTAAMKPEYYKYLLNHIGETPVQKELRETGESMERPMMMASADEYAFLGWLCETLGVRRAVEVGVFRGVTTLAMALHMPDDGLIRALDVSREFAQVGFDAWKKAGVDKKIDFIEGPAAASMQKLLDQGEAGTYDFVFIDANKDEYPQYYELAVQLVRQGGVIAVDNTLMHGDVIDANEADERAEPLRRANDMIKNDKRVSAVMSIIADGVYFVRKL